MMAKVEGYSSFKKNPETSVVANANMTEYNRYMKQKAIRDQKKQQDSDKIKILEEQIQKLMELVGATR
jgi:hypothetical protein